MDDLTGLMGTAGPEVYIILGIIILAFGYFAVRGILRLKRRSSEPPPPQTPVEPQAPPKETSTQEQADSILGKGTHNCMCFRPGNILDFTTIPKPIGEVYQFETTLPVSGAGFIVKELSDGSVVDYDPRKVEFKIKQSPEYAWFARHWDIVRVVFSVPLQWWRSPATWFALGMMLIVFICGLVVFD